MNAGRSPSRSGETTKCQWLGIKQQAHNRIRRVRSVSSTTRSNAKKSSSLVKSTLRPTPRSSTWKTIPPDNIASVVTFTAFYQDIPASSIWWLSHFTFLVAVTFHLSNLFRFLIPFCIPSQDQGEGNCPATVLRGTLRRLGRRIGQRGDATRAPTQGPRPERAARCRPTAYRDWPKSDKSIHSSCSQSLA